MKRKIEKKQFQFKGLETLQEVRPGAIGELISIEKIYTAPQQPRRYFDPVALEELVESAKKMGIMLPLLVRPKGEDAYELVAGERRFRAAKQAGLEQVPVIIKQLSDEEAFEIALFENLHRRDLNPLEETEAILKILTYKLKQPQEWVVNLFHRAANKGRESVNVVIHSPEWKLVEDFFSLLNLSPGSFRSNRLVLLSLPVPLLEALRMGKIEYTKAIIVSRIKSPKQQKEVLDALINSDMSVTDLKLMIRELQRKESTEVIAERGSSIEHRVKSVFKQLRKSKPWVSSDKSDQLEDLLSRLEALLVAS